MDVTLIRHTAVDVPPGTCYGQTDVPLRPTFPQEAARVHRSLDEFRPFDAVYVSPLSRCVRLAAWCGYPDAVCEARLMELNFGEWEMQRYDAIRDPRLAAWYADYLHVPATGGESFLEQLARVCIDGGDVVYSFAYGIDIHHRAARQYHGRVCGKQFTQQPECIGLVLCGAVIICQSERADKVMLHPCQLLGRGRSRSYGQVGVQLPRVGRKDAGAESFGQAQAQFGFPDARGADKYDEGGHWVHCLYFNQENLIRKGASSYSPVCKSEQILSMCDTKVSLKTYASAFRAASL